MNHQDPWEVLIRAMARHSEEADGPEPESIKDARWLHMDAAADCAKAALPFVKVKAEGGMIDDPTSELEELKRIILAMQRDDRETVLRYLRRISNGGQDAPRL